MVVAAEKFNRAKATTGRQREAGEKLRRRQALAAGALQLVQPQRPAAAGDDDAARRRLPASSRARPGAATAAARQIFSPAPGTRADAPGNGLNARTWRSIAAALSRQSMRLRPCRPWARSSQASVCGRARSSPRASASSARTISPAPSCASLSCRLPPVSSAAMGRDSREQHRPGIEARVPSA